MAQSLMAIRKTITAGGRQFTHTAGRNDNTGHADLAWALFHALHNEPLEGRPLPTPGGWRFLMSNRRRNNKQLAQAPGVVTQEFIPRSDSKMEAFSFGEPSPVLSGREVFDYLECWFNGR
ncbi:terminase ATPase subunit [Pseudomonas sp. 34 E 7]|nr:terminase ATPase subunit [Pseudomonas sp. 34 E 7]